MNAEDEAFNEIERRAKQRMESVRVAMRGEDDDIQEYKRPWVGLTEEERFEIRMHSVQNMGENFQETLCKTIEAKLKEKNCL